MRKEWKKLVRDQIPVVLERKGVRAETRILEGEEYLAALRAKVHEEAVELCEARGIDVLSETADLLEVIDALVKAQGLSLDDVRVERERKRNERGVFEQRVWLEATEE